MSTINTRVKHKRDTSSNWTSKNPVLLNGELIIVDTAEGDLRFKIGDGVKTYTQLPFTDEAILGEISDVSSELVTHTGDSDIHVAASDKTKWNTAYTHSQASHAPSNAEKNQNAFSKFAVGSTTIEADNATDTLTLVAGDNVTITSDATNDKITITAKDTVYTHPSHTPKSSGLYKIEVDSEGHVSSATAVGKSDIIGLGIPEKDTTYSAATSTTAGLMSAAHFSKLEGIAEGANKTIVDSSLSSTSTNPVQNKVVQAALAGKAPTHDHPYINTSLKGVANGVAELDSNGKVPSSQLPSYVDDVVEGTYVSSTSFKNSSGTAISGETGKIYVDTTSSKTYRWSGSAFTEISASLALGETSSTAYRGDRGKTAYDHSQTTGNPHGTTASDVGASTSTHGHDVNVTGSNKSSTVTGSVTVPKVSRTQKYLTASASVPTVTPTTDTVLGTGTKFTVSGGVASTTKLSATASGAAVGANGTAVAITGFGTHTTANAITALNTTTVKNPTVTSVSIPNVTGNTSVSIPNVTGNTSVTATKISSFGSLPSMTSSVDSNGVLGFTFSAGSLPTGSDVSASKVTLGTALSASKVTTSDVTVATGAKSTAAAITALGTASTATVLTGVKMTAQPTITVKSGTTGDVSVATGVSDVSVTASGDNVTVITGVEVSAPAITLANNDTNVTGSVPVVSDVSISTESKSLQNGSAAAQVWSQETGSTGSPK